VVATCILTVHPLMIAFYFFSFFFLSFLSFGNFDVVISFRRGIFKAFSSKVFSTALCCFLMSCCASAYASGLQNLVNSVSIVLVCIVFALFCDFVFFAIAFCFSPPDVNK
jgi:hypothetical protein